MTTVSTYLDAPFFKHVTRAEAEELLADEPLRVCLVRPSTQAGYFRFFLFLFFLFFLWMFFFVHFVLILIVNFDFVCFAIFGFVCVRVFGRLISRQSCVGVVART